MQDVRHDHFRFAVGLTGAAVRRGQPAPAGAA
jgi:hypothetical protein